MKIRKLYDENNQIYTPFTSIDSVYDGNFSIKSNIENMSQYTDLIDKASRTIDITIHTSDWVNNTCVKTIEGINQSMMVIVQSNTESRDEYITCGIKCINQGTDYIEFSCISIPTNDISVEVLGIECINLSPINSLEVIGDWTNPQYTNAKVDYTGLTIIATYQDGSIEVVTPDRVYPDQWSKTPGTQIATFMYGGCTITKSANIIDIKDVPLTFKAGTNGNIYITKTGNPGTIYYSLNNGPQTELASDVEVDLVVGDRISIYRTVTGNLSSSNYFTIKCTSEGYIYGNIMSLYDKDNFSDIDTITYNAVFYRLFYDNTRINIDRSIGDLILPATTVTNFCYQYMFNGCTSLTTSPELPAINLSRSCYWCMFQGCTSLTTTPKLPATALADYCYNSMFQDCTSLTTTPDLHATTLANSCYSSMFSGCINLTSVTNLPATSLVGNCYGSMFSGCTNLTIAPELPATKLANNCYNGMFSGCTNLNEITCLATDISSTSCTTSWVNGVSSTGTFVKDGSMTDWSTGSNGIPSGWIVRNK